MRCSMTGLKGLMLALSLMLPVVGHADARLQTVMQRVAAGEAITLATLGGSITTGYAAQPPRERGWAALLEVEVEAREDELRLVPLDDAGTLVRKHFLQLDGLGVRDLHFCGDDLFILAGPTMVLDGEIRLFRWPGARTVLAGNHEPVRFQSELAGAVSLPHGRGTNRAEAICNLPTELTGGEPSWLVLYDAPGANRRDGEHAVFGDLLQHA